MIRRHANLKRTPLKRSAVAIKRRPVKRKRAKLRRVSVDRNQAYKNWLKDKTCVCCGRGPGNGIHWPLIIDPAHTEHNNGMSSKGADSSCAPLCRGCHERYDSSRERFELETGLDMKAVAAKWYGKFLNKVLDTQ